MTQGNMILSEEAAKKFLHNLGKKAQRTADRHIAMLGAGQEPEDKQAFLEAQGLASSKEKKKKKTYKTY